MKLTQRQQIVLDLIRTYIDEQGLPPTRAEIAQHLGFKSVNAAEEHLKALAKKGAIEIMPGTSRGIRLPESPPPGLPIIGQVAAGFPILALEHIEHYSPIPAQLFSPAADYLLRVQGMSMQGIGIVDQDLVAIHRTQQVNNGDIVVARVGDEVTLKRFFQQQQLVRLEPENPDYPTLQVDLQQDEFAIEGRYVGLIRLH